MHHISSIAKLRQILEISGLQAGMEFLNNRVPHRYTVVYKFDGVAFYGMLLVDKQQERSPELFKRVPFEDSFCQYTVDDGVFRTEASLDDSRLDGHIHQTTVQSYTGLPLTNSKGELYGTFCHLDTQPQSLSEDEYAFLQRAVALMGGHLPTISQL